MQGVDSTFQPQGPANAVTASVPCAVAGLSLGTGEGDRLAWEIERWKGSQLVMAVQTSVLRRWFPGPLACGNVNSKWRGNSRGLCCSSEFM